MEQMFWMLFFVALLAGVIWYMVAKHERERKEERLRPIIYDAYQLQKQLKKVNELKTPKSRVTRCEKAIAILEKHAGNTEAREVITNLDEVFQRLKSMKKVIPVVDYVERAYKHEFKGKDNAEKNALLDALYHIRMHRVTNADFFTAGVLPEATGEIIQIENIEKRLRELGWDE